MTQAHPETPGRRRLRRPRTLVIVLVVLSLAAGAGAVVHHLLQPEPPTHLCGILPTQELVPLVGEDPHQDYTNDDAPPVSYCQVSGDTPDDPDRIGYMTWEAERADYITQYLGDELKPTQTREQVGNATLATYLQSPASACAYWIEGEHALTACANIEYSGRTGADASDLIEPVKELVRTYGHQALANLYPNLYPDTTATPTP